MAKTDMMHPGDIAHEFVKAINEHDINRIADLMGDDHCFNDPLDHRVVGRERMLEGLEG